MTREQAVDWRHTEGRGGACVVYEFDSSGRIVHAPPKSANPVRRIAAMISVAGLSLFGALNSACGGMPPIPAGVEYEPPRQPESPDESSSEEPVQQPAEHSEAPREQTPKAGVR
ncbi:MAG: hypothetical protein KC561_06430 [Myxococcales bacterium]|nr:hypothetical protein [Myxococcales bacterium]